MDHFAGLDVSVKETSVCIVDEAGKVVREVKVASEPEALLSVLKNPAYRFKRIGLEAGPLSQWLFSALAEAELPVVCVETRHMQAALKAQINKTDHREGFCRGRWPRVAVQIQTYRKSSTTSRRARRWTKACPSWWFHCVKLAPNPRMKSLRDQTIGDWRRKSAADADRPRVFRKQPVTTHRCRQQRADAIGERDQRRLGIRKHGAATAQNERALRVRQRLGEAFNGPGIGVQAAARRRQLQWREVRGEGH